MQVAVKFMQHCLITHAQHVHASGKQTSMRCCGMLCAMQVRQLFPSARNLNCTWHSIVKIGQSLYREAPGMDPYRPDQTTPVPNFFLAGSYTKQVCLQLGAGFPC